MIDISKMQNSIALEQSIVLDIEIRNLCRTHWFEPENIKDTPYKLVIEHEPENISIYLTKIVDVNRIQFNLDIICN